ncbi:cytohesin-interacting protein [Pantherophis guttatus]|uniref:Cytohesin-interacting protein n=1 Tax=Pantherophis guttatus TaxID=94885 RepID=A0A6P9CAT0_PANGU|nr:cytohesin-interacting protein [Pantherophis guttatus]
MSLKRLIQQRGNANCVGYCLSSNYSPSLEPIDGPSLDNQGSQMFSDPTGRLSKDCKQLALNRTSSISKSSGPHRKTFKIFKEDNETFGFEIQCQSNRFMETCTYICNVKGGSPASLTGLQHGYILVSINGVSIKGLSHKEQVDMIKSSRNFLRLDTVNEALIMKRMELETKLHCMKKTLQDKLAELQALCLREKDLARGEVCSLPDSAGLEGPNIFGDHAGLESHLGSKARFSSESSCLSRLSSMTMDSEDSFYQSSVFEDPAKEIFSRQSSTEDDCFLPIGSNEVKKTSLRRHRSISVTSNVCRSPSKNGDNFSKIFGTLPRKSRKGSIQRKLLTFIPGLHRAVEVDESRI